MTSPGQGDQWSPQQPGGYPPGQPYGGQQYPHDPQAAQAQYPGQQHQYPQQPHPQPFDPATAQQPGYQGYQGYYGQQQDAFPVPPQQGPPAKRKRGLIIALVAALVVAGGGVASWFAFWQSDSVASGAATPNEAAMNFASALGSGDVVGLLGTLTPAEASLFTDPIGDVTGELKRLGILTQDANPEQITGLQIETENLRFDESQAEQVNDHLTITKLTGGKLTLTSDLSQVPLADEYRDLALESADLGGPSMEPQTETIDIAEVVRETGEPIRIATVKVGDEWYPSLLYSIADYALLEAGEEWPAQSIPANGAGSPDEAVRATVQAALDGDLRRVVELLPPDEMGVLHDVGPVLLDALGEPSPAGVEIKRLETENSEVTGGTRATITALELDIEGQGTFELTKDGDCYAMTVQGQSDRLCADQLAAMAAGETDGDMPPELQQIFTNVGGGIMEQGLGVVTTEVDGKHYVSPIRTFTEFGMTFLRSMQPEDLRTILENAN
ncbi:flagellar basal body-associated FliL family protein [Prauserella endophytica]|uniref:Flagellar basal body protein FliL n=1 Tax=Prauserella endophytica TaxID=1592324 RepID=A0ABY2S6M0_9PSEU|nr:flagellar basal body protein FliL [Prauserella endophytica]TKG71237.1 flagellar basal body protein FliL [Prauserella endophytica]